MAAPGANFTLDASQLDCPICHMTMYKAVSVLPCLHKFCHLCVLRWSLKANTCPECREPFSEVKADPFARKIVDQFISAFPNQHLCLDEKIERILRKKGLRETHF